MKRILFLIILIFSFFSLNRADINDVTFVKTIGISENDGHVEMILNTIVPEKGLDTSTYQIQSIVLEGHDVGEMLNSFLSEHYQHVSFDQLELLLLDDEMTQNFSQLVEPVMNRFVRLNFYVGLVKDADIAELVDAGNHPCFPAFGQGAQREHMRQDGLPLLFVKGEVFFAGLRSYPRMIEGLYLSLRQLIPKVVHTEVMQQAGPCGNTGVPAELLSDVPGKIGNIQTVHQARGLIMLPVPVQLFKFSVIQYALHEGQKIGADIVRDCNLHRQSHPFFRQRPG